MLCKLADMFRAQETLFPAAICNLPLSIIYTNEADFDPRWAHHLLSHAYAARTVQCEPIVIGKLPRGTMLCGAHDFLLQLGDNVAEESLPHSMRDDVESVAAAMEKPGDPIDLEDECVLLTRFGHGTWGHWLGELVPIAAVVEHRYPGRFRYAVPRHSTAYGATMRETLRAYGIEASRIIPMPWNRPHRLANAWAVTVR